MFAIHSMQSSDVASLPTISRLSSLALLSAVAARCIQLSGEANGECRCFGGRLDDLRRLLDLGYAIARPGLEYPQPTDRRWLDSFTVANSSPCSDPCPIRARFSVGHAATRRR